MTENVPTPEDDAGADETTVLNRRDLDDHAGRVGLHKGGSERRSADVDSGATAWGAGESRASGDEATVIAPAVGASTAWPTTPERPVTAERTVRPEPAVVEQPAVQAPVQPVDQPVDQPAARGRKGRRRLAPGEEAVVFPSHRPWTMVLAGILALLWGIEAVFELVANWSRVRPTPGSGRYALAITTVSHSSTSLSHFIAQVALNQHFRPTDRLDARLALGSFAVVWLIIGLLLLLARGSGIRLGLLWCGLLALPAFGLVRGGVDAYSWGLRHLVGASITGGFAAPLILVVIIAVLTGTRRARLFSGRPYEPEYVEINDPGDVWRDR